MNKLFMQRETNCVVAYPGATISMCSLLLAVNQQHQQQKSCR